MRIPTPSLTVLLAALLVQLGACAETRDTFHKTLARRSATFDRNMLEVIPCLNDAIRTRYGVSASSNASNFRALSTDPRYLKNRLEVALTPADAGVPAGETRTLVYELFDRSNAGSGVRYGVEADGPTKEAWWDEAFDLIASCGGVSK